ncbi:hypothetical protein H6G20_07040 [Desertifilum sp. FACHB-1129]|uniref:Uncharacterized protein n=1 Tax=Desertifilum tharense IPPAS B-1220 TaxID=1781255 RepID=A0A1E5QD89_9CYAN|nr:MULTISPECIES: hypothetical protein [Desertifilum]MDA0213511.1 hypothetical protein [Cyanobacteria bacterium FC1]MBD2311412.1 hypothetical protein [Desertifilum sp. FACHB-1129]MBD2321658.1 hypothetical protein [Desertifilum sp. FACHB-866]MBD2331785.1 hypothetical protein [Desertifilum sp. FACHB-868]OEJ72544.1 hypothetical protein BH720_23870 [Desertifilum tharense IPPAS B-1220]
MKFTAFTTATLLAVLGVGTPVSVLAQPSPTGSYVPGYWQPEAQVSLNRPITVRILNQTGIPLEYGLSGVDVYTLGSNASVDVGVNLSNRPGNTATIAINAQRGTYALRYEYNVTDNNVLQVRVIPGGGPQPLDRAVYIDETGRVYSF